MTEGQSFIIGQPELHRGPPLPDARRVEDSLFSPGFHQVLTHPPAGWQADHTIDFTGEGVRLENGVCFIPLVSECVKVGDRVEFRIEVQGEWGGRFSGGGVILSTQDQDAKNPNRGVVIQFVFLDANCKDSVLFACTQGTLF